MNRRDGFGLFVILGWQNKWNKFTDVPDSRQDIYVRHHVNVMHIGKKDARHDIESTVNFDGAILVNEKGEIEEGYSFQFWLPADYDQEFMAVGAFRHYLWIDRKRDFVAAQFSIGGERGQPGISSGEKEAVMRALGTFVLLESVPGGDSEH